MTKYAWDPEDPMCTACGTGLCLNDGYEWSDIPEANVCHSCAVEFIERAVTGQWKAPGMATGEETP